MISLYLSLINTEDEQGRFEQLYIRYRTVMFYAALNILKDERLAEDAVHEAFLSIIDNFSKISAIPCHKIKSFFVIIVKHKAIDIYRKRKRQYAESFDETLYFDAAKLSDDSCGELAAAVLRLPDIYRDTLKLKYIHGFSTLEISEILNVNEATVTKRIERAKQKLFDMLSEEAYSYDK